MQRKLMRRELTDMLFLRAEEVGSVFGMHRHISHSFAERSYPRFVNGLADYIKVPYFPDLLLNFLHDQLSSPNFLIRVMSLMTISLFPNTPSRFTTPLLQHSMHPVIPLVSAACVASAFAQLQHGENMVRVVIALL